jgi:hypothetical protein
MEIARLRLNIAVVKKYGVGEANGAKRMVIKNSSVKS